MLPVKPSLAAVAAGGVLALGSMLFTAPAFPASAAITCADATSAATAALTAERNAAQRLASAQAKLTQDQAALAAAQRAIPSVPADISSARTAVAADEKLVADATTAHNAAVTRLNDAEKVRVAACAGTAPVARDDTYSTAMNSNLVIAASGILGNDSDADGDPLSATLITGAQHGNVNISGNGAFTYVPTTNYTGPDQFTYKACDPGGKCDPATVFITVKGATPPPPPVDLPGHRVSCADYATQNIFDIRRGTDNRYRGYLDPDHDGIACERNGEGKPPPVVIPGPQGPTGPQGPQGPAGSSGSANGSSSTVIVVPPAPTGEGFSQIGQAPAGAAQTGFGPNA